MASKTKLGKWFHAVPALANLHRTVVVVDAKLMPVGKAMTGSPSAGLKRIRPVSHSGWRPPNKGRS